MSYCVHCGVKLDPSASVCPLCQTPVQNPRQPVDHDSPRFYPPPQIVTSVVQNHFAVIAASILLLMGGVICLIIDIAVNRAFTWSRIAAGATALFWVVALMPVLLPRPNIYGLILLDCLCVIAYLYLMQMIFPDRAWFASLALPLVIACGLSIMLVVCLARSGMLHKLSLASCALILLGAVMILLETRLDLFLEGRLSLDWSWGVFAITFALALLLAIINIFQGLKFELKKRLHL